MVYQWSAGGVNADFKVVDFGMAQSPNSKAAVRKVDERDICGGSLFYMTPETVVNYNNKRCSACTTQPEHVSNKPCCVSQDLWALALTLGQFWSGRKFWNFKTPPGSVARDAFFAEYARQKNPTYPDMPTSIRSYIYRMLAPVPADRPCDLQEFLDIVEATAKENNVDLSPLKYQEASSRERAADRFLLEGESMLSLAYYLQDPEAKQDTLNAAQRAFVSAISATESVLQDEDSLTDADRKYHHLLLQRVYRQLGAIETDLARAEAAEQLAIALKNQQVSRKSWRPTISASLYRHLVGAVTAYQQAYTSLDDVPDSDHEDDAEVSHFLNFLLAVKNVADAETLDGKDAEAILATGVIQGYSAALGASPSVDEYRMKLNDYFTKILVHTQLDDMPLTVYSLHPDHQPLKVHSLVRRKAGETGKFRCLEDNQIGSITKIDLFGRRYRIKGPTYNSCWVPYKAVELSPVQAAELTVGDLVVLRQSEGRTRQCGLFPGDVGIIISHDKKDPKFPYQVLGVHHQDMWCKNEQIQLAPASAGAYKATVFQIGDRVMLDENQELKNLRPGEIGEIVSDGSHKDGSSKHGANVLYVRNLIRDSEKPAYFLFSQLKLAPPPVATMIPTVTIQIEPPNVIPVPQGIAKVPVKEGALAVGDFVVSRETKAGIRRCGLYPGEVGLIIQHDVSDGKNPYEVLGHADKDYWCGDEVVKRYVVDKAKQVKPAAVFRVGDKVVLTSKKTIKNLRPGEIGEVISDGSHADGSSKHGPNVVYVRNTGRAGDKGAYFMLSQLQPAPKRR
jgi:hypothetical protein